MKKETWLACAAGLIIVLFAFGFTSETFRAKAKAQIDISAGAGDDGPFQASYGEPPLNHGVIPDKYPVHIPRFAHMGPHRMYQHPATCSPHLYPADQQAWMYGAPAQGDL